jgi:3-dehydroquinate synthase
MTRIVKARTRSTGANYDVRIESGSLRQTAGVFSDHAMQKVAIISNKKVFDLYGGPLETNLKSLGVRPCTHLIGDGERYKDLKTLEGILEFLSENGISRTDMLVSLGGGVIGDVAGFAASIYLRGIRYVQIPTTLLAMIDSSVGGKTGINSKFGKNLIGAFYQPEAVLIDPTVLNTLPGRELMAGLCEAVKQGAIASRNLFDQTVSIVDRLGGVRFVERSQDKRFLAKFEDFLATQIEFKSRIVEGDQRESVQKNNARSRKILNFGHTFAHALEKASNYKYLKHGEAVGHGIVFAATLSKTLGILDENVVNLLRGVVHRTGRLPSIRHIDSHTLFESFRFDKKNVGGSLQWVLLKGIGRPVIVPHDKIGDGLIKQTIKEIISA